MAFHDDVGVERKYIPRMMAKIHQDSVKPICETMICKKILALFVKNPA
jgi:hypothetical protein